MSATSDPTKPTSAHHSSSWPECYDLWVRQLFGSGPSEDVAVFRDVLQSVLDDVSSNQDFRSSTPSAEPRTITVLDIGTGTGRVIIDFLNSIAGSGMHMDLAARPPCPRFKFRFVGLEPSLPMLQRARMKLRQATKQGILPLPKRSSECPDVESEVIWVHGSATSLDDTHALPDTRSESVVPNKIKNVDLAVFAAGGICHLTELKELDGFLEGIAKVLAPDGRLVISILDEFRSGLMDDEEAPKLAEAQELADKVEKHEPVRIRSVDNPELTFVKYPTLQTWNEVHTVRTDRFRLSIENAGRVVMNEELEWKNRRFDVCFWQQKIAERGLQLIERIDGKIQVWWVLGRSST